MEFNLSNVKTNQNSKEKVIALTNSPEEIRGINLNQSFKLKKWLLSSDEWIIVETLEKILFPFFKATEYASFQNYPTLAISLVIKNSLQSHLCMSGTSDEALIKQISTERLLCHLDTKIEKKKGFTQVLNFVLKIITY